MILIAWNAAIFLKPEIHGSCLWAHSCDTLLVAVVKLGPRLRSLLTCFILTQATMFSQLNQTTRESKREQVVKMLTSEWNRTPSPHHLFTYMIKSFINIIYNCIMFCKELSYNFDNRSTFQWFHLFFTVEKVSIHTNVPFRNGIYKVLALPFHVVSNSRCLCNICVYAVFLLQFRQEYLDTLYRYAKFQYECGNYSGAAEYLYFFRVLVSFQLWSHTFNTFTIYWTWMVAFADNRYPFT